LKYFFLERRQAQMLMGRHLCLPSDAMRAAKGQTTCIARGELKGIRRPLTAYNVLETKAAD
jgi:hypothetical protein